MTATAERNAVQDQLCARIDELEREKEALAAQLDQAEEKIDSLGRQANALHRIASTLDLWSQAGASVSIDAVAEAATRRVEELVTTEALAEEKLAMLRGQADALHRIGSTLDLYPGTDLTREAPARVEALVAHIPQASLTIDAILKTEGSPLYLASKMRRWRSQEPTTSLALHDAARIGDLAMRWDREGDAQLESGCSGIEHQGRGRKYAACLAANESNRIRKEAQGGEL